jgi:hypothetical protein
VRSAAEHFASLDFRAKLGAALSPQFFGALRLLGILATAAHFACGSSLPSYAAPQGGLATDEEIASGDLIPYRTLTRADFLASAPSGPASGHTDKVGALTHALIKHDPGIAFAGKEITSPNGDRRVEGRIQNLYFRAWMDRSRSWWNPKRGEAPESYVLQHEQIHFAIVEIEARKMNAEGARLMQKTFKADSSQEIQKDLETAVTEIIKDGMDRVLERSTDFDEETSVNYDPKKQNVWWQRVQSELGSGS